jgi:hypothetical protein
MLMPDSLVQPIGLLVITHGGVCKSLITRNDAASLATRKGSTAGRQIPRFARNDVSSLETRKGGTVGRQIPRFARNDVSSLETRKGGTVGRQIPRFARNDVSWLRKKAARHANYLPILRHVVAAPRFS